MTKKMWYALTSDGRWLPTGCSDKDEAIWYMKTYPGSQHVRDWMFL